MAWANGFWTPDDDDVGAQVAKVVSSGSPLLKQARGLGAAFSNARGLGNSSIAAGATQDSLYKVALPIASQNAQQIAQKNLSALEANQQMRYGVTLQQMQDTAALERLNKQITSTEGMAVADRGAAMTQLNAQISAQAARDASDQQAQMARLETQLGSASELQRGSISADMERLKTQIAGNRELAESDSAAQLARQQLQLATQEKLAGDDITSRERLSTAATQAEREMQALRGEQAMGLQKLTGQQQFDQQAQTLAAAAQERITNASANINASYLSAMQAMMANENIPADVRAAYGASLQKASEASLAIVEQIYGVDLAWGNNTAARPAVAETVRNPALDASSPISRAVNEAGGLGQYLTQIAA